MVKLPKRIRRYLARTTFDDQRRRIGERGEEWLDIHLSAEFEILPSRTRAFDRIYVTWERRKGRPSAADQVIHNEYGAGSVESVDDDRGMILVRFDSTGQGSSTRRSLPFPSDDCIINARSEIHVEIKTEPKSNETNRAFIETVSRDRPETVDGWAHTSTADYLYHFIPQTGIVRAVPISRLRDALPGWHSQFGEKRSPGTWSVDGKLLYYSYGVPVPLAKLDRITEKIFEIEPMPLTPSDSPSK